MKLFRNTFIDFSGIILIGLVIAFMSFVLPINGSASSILPNSFLNLNTIFMSIMIEALPFILIGVIIAGFIQMFVTEDHVRKWIPKNKIAATFMGCVVGSLFPACECGIVPIVRRLIAKGVPLPAAIGFMLTGPLINPIVIFSTYMAFGKDLEMALSRMWIGFVAALIIAIIIGFLFNGTQTKKVEFSPTVLKVQPKQPFLKKLNEMFKHTIDEFFDMGKFLIIGAFLAAAVQTYVSSKALLSFGEGLISSTLVMMGLAFILSLCSEADAFIGASFKNVFSETSILAFLVYGPMIDLKNTLMLLAVFRVRFVFVLVSVISVVVFSVILLASGF